MELPKLFQSALQATLINSFACKFWDILKTGKVQQPAVRRTG